MKPLAESVQILSFSWPLFIQLASLAAMVVAVAYVLLLLRCVALVVRVVVVGYWLLCWLC